MRYWTDDTHERLITFSCADIYLFKKNAQKDHSSADKTIQSRHSERAKLVPESASLTERQFQKNGVLIMQIQLVLC